MVTSLDSEFKPVKLSLKIDCVSHSACVEGLGKYISIAKERTDGFMPFQRANALK